MTRTYLMQLANQIRDRPLDKYPSPNRNGIVYEGRFMRKPIHCLYTTRGVLVCVHYNRVLYQVTNTGNTAITHDVSEFYKDHQCTTKVYLYQNSYQLLFIDEEGRFGSNAAVNKSFACDYMDLIPLPQL